MVSGSRPFPHVNSGKKWRDNDPFVLNYLCLFLWQCKNLVFQVKCQLQNSDTLLLFTIFGLIIECFELIKDNYWNKFGDELCDQSQVVCLPTAVLIKLEAIFVF